MLKMKLSFFFFILFLGIIKLFTKAIDNKTHSLRKLANENKKLTNIINIYYPEDQVVYYISSITNSNGDLFILTNNNEISETRVIYAIMDDGSSFFEDSEQPYKVINCGLAANNSYITLTFYNINGLEYLATYSQGNQFELIDLKRRIIYYTYHYQVLTLIPHIKKDLFTSLKFYDNSDYIISSFVSRKDGSVIIHKLSYDSILNNQLSPTDPIKLCFAYKASSLNCFEIDKYIECLYLTSEGYYTIIIVDIETLDIKFSRQIETQIVNTDYLFSKCIHFKDNIGAFIYFINKDSKPKLIFKELIIPSDPNSDLNLVDFFSSIIINKNNKFSLGNEYLFNNIIKKNENTIFYINTKRESETIIIVLIRFLNDYNNLSLLYYEIKIKELNNLKIFKDITWFIFNEFLGIGMTHYDYSKSYTKTYSSYFIIGNSLCYDTNIEDDIDIFDEDNIYEFKLEKIHINIENNIFNYSLKGIQIISDLSEDNLGFNLYSNNKQNYLELNDIILYNDTINFKIVSNLGVKLGSYSIEYIPIISEVNYEDINSIFDSVEYYPNTISDFSNYYKPEAIKIKKANILFSVNKCYKTCENCIYHGNNNNHKCEICSSNYPY